MPRISFGDTPLKRSDFQFELPTGLIAQQPLENRSDSRLLHVSRSGARLQDHKFTELPGLLRQGDLLVFNNTRVIPARLFGRKETGGRVEIMLERIIDDHECIAQLRVSKTPRPGSRIVLEDGTWLEMTCREGAFFRLKAPAGGLGAKLEQLGHMPLPPYIERQDSPEDRER